MLSIKMNLAFLTLDKRCVVVLGQQDAQNNAAATKLKEELEFGGLDLGDLNTCKCP